MNESTIGSLLVLGLGTIAAVLLSLGLIIVIRPWLARHALARPNARSSHHAPTPQGGGIAVVAATLVVAWGSIILSPTFVDFKDGQFQAATLAVILLACGGFVDDIRTLPAGPRLLLQCIAVGTVVAALPKDLHVLPLIPWWMERIGLLLAGVWFVNLTNFMDGIDWMTVAETVPLAGAIALLGAFGAVPAPPTLVATALLGAMLGFAPFNKPIAKLFLGDVGSLPIGLLIGWLLLQLAGSGHLAAALILPLYYLADATITLLRRVVRGEPFWQAHRSHFYQRALDRGFTVSGIVARVFVVNLALAALALVTVAVPNVIVACGALLTGAAIIGWLLRTFTRGKR